MKFTFDKRPACLHSDLDDLNSYESLIVAGWRRISVQSMFSNRTIGILFLSVWDE